MKKVYQPPALKVVEFKVERGYQSSLNSPMHESFSGELWGNEQFFDDTPSDINDNTIGWHIF